MRWAEMHLDALQRRSRDFINEPANRPSLRADIDIESGYHVFRVKPLPDYRAISTETGLGIGDVIGNLRAALDHAVWAMTNDAATASGLRNPELVSFPINKTISEVANSRAGKAIRPYLDPRVWQIIERAAFDQLHPGVHGIGPINGWPGNGHPLAVLQALSNDDKHHVLPTLFVLPVLWGIPDSLGLGPIAMRRETIGREVERGAYLAVSGYSSVPGTVVEVLDYYSALAGTPLELNAEIGRARFEITPGSHLDNAGQVTPEIAFKGHSPVMQTLDFVARFVKFTLGEFERVLP